MNIVIDILIFEIKFCLISTFNLHQNIKKLPLLVYHFCSKFDISSPLNHINNKVPITKILLFTYKGSVRF